MRKYQLIAPLAGAALALAGCGSSHSNSGPSQTATKTAATSTASGPTNSGEHAAAQPYLARLHTVTTLGSTVPANGDVNPYGLVRVSSTVGTLHAGSFLVSNFNDK